MADSPVGSPEWWLRRLHTALIERRPAVQRSTDYYEGFQNLAFESDRFRKAFGAQLSAFADNWCAVVVDAVEERLNVEGFRVGREPAGDDDAWRIWQANDMDGQIQLAHTDALVSGIAYLIPWVGENETTPEICVANAHDAIVECHPKMHRRRRAGLRVYRDEWGHDNAELFLPDGVHMFRSAKPRDDMLIVDAVNVGWVAGEVQPNPLGVVPVIPLPNRPRIRNSRHGIRVQSEIHEIIPLQDAVNKLVADMLVGSEKQALPARWATGLEVPVDPVTNRPVKPEVDTASLMINDSSDGSFGSFPAADLRNFVQGIEMLVQHIASLSRTPPHYLNASADRLSGEALALDTPIPTPDGWRMMGSLRAGDEVFGPDGAVESVVNAFGVLTGRPCFRVSFDDGSEIVADAGHKWVTDHYVSPTNLHRGREVGIVTTDQLAATVRATNGVNHRISTAGAVECPIADLPIDPYVLGCWLGDGSRGHGHMTCHEDDVATFEAEWANAGEDLHVYRPDPIGKPGIWRVHANRMRGRLNKLGVLAHKHIPEEYLWASPAQRLALLQGLMDTDGTVKKGQGSVEYTCHEERLSADVVQLVRSLGHKARLRSRPAKFKGEIVGTQWRLVWGARDPVFRLARKLERQRWEWSGGLGRANKPLVRYVVAVEPVESVPVRCITVTGESHLFLAGASFIPTHNSIKAAETGLVAKTRNKMRFFGEGEEEAMRLAGRLAGIEHLASAESMEIIWSDPESRTEGQHVDAILKQKDLGVPEEILWEKLGYSPQEIARIKAIKAEEDLFAPMGDNLIEPAVPPVGA